MTERTRAKVIRNDAIRPCSAVNGHIAADLTRRDRFRTPDSRAQRTKLRSHRACLPSAPTTAAEIGTPSRTMETTLGVQRRHAVTEQIVWHPSSAMMRRLRLGDEHPSATIITSATPVSRRRGCRLAARPGVIDDLPARDQCAIQANDAADSPPRRPRTTGSVVGTMGRRQAGGARGRGRAGAARIRPALSWGGKASIDGHSTIARRSPALKIAEGGHLLRIYQPSGNHCS